MTDFTFDRISVICEKLKELMVCERVELSGFLYRECEYKKGIELPPVDENWKEFKKGERWGGKKDSHCWFYKKIVLPESLHQKNVELQIITGQEGQWDADNPQFIVYVDGQTVQALDTNHTSVILSGKTEYEVYLYAYSGMIEKLLEFIPALRVIENDTKTLYYHIKTPLDVAAFLNPGEKTYIDIMEYLNQTVNLLDLRIPYSIEYQTSVKAAIQYMEDEFYDGFCKEQEISTICIGHTHIDVAWLWTIDQTVEKAQRSFATVVNLMKQYPEYKFMSSQPQLYAFVKREDPALFEEIQKLVKEGRWEVEGAMWLEADCNLPSGESLVRQILYGKRFMQEEFGVNSHILWLPDVFGYSAALPQILRKAGVDTFVTSKISWNEMNQMPYDTFSWEGIDGTEIFSYFLTAQDKVRGKETDNFTTYNGMLTPAATAGTWERYQQKNLSNECILTYGYGDGGGGPTAEMLETGRRLEKGINGCPQVKFDTVTNFISRLKEKTEHNPNLPKWVGELYLELHRGTYTSIAKNKRNNRKSEFLYQDAELFSSMNKFLLGKEYPEKILHEGWEKIITRQFHDIVPGSSIKEVYDECDRTYAQLKKDGEELIDSCLSDIGNNVQTDGGILVFNPNSFEGNGIVTVGKTKLYASNIPAKGYKVITPETPKENIICEDYRMENEFFRIVFDEKYTISAIYDKRNRREVLKAGERANVMQVFEDYPRCYDAWEITNYYTEKMWEIDDVSSVCTVDEGVRKGCRIIRKYQNSTIEQTIWIYEDIDRIDFDTHMDWKEDHLLVKAAFPVDVHADKASYDVQFGTVERPTHRNTSWDAAKFEVCGHKFADLSEYGYGVSLLNDCKYGYDIHGNVMRLTLLKCATYPYPEADKCGHEFVYSLYPHAGSWREADTVKHAFDLNNPLRAVEVPAQKGSLPAEYSFVNADCDNIVIDTIKKAEDSDDLIVRLYECKNKRTEAKICFGFDVTGVTTTDLMENNIEVLETLGNSVRIAMKPFEIVTLKVSYF